MRRRSRTRRVLKWLGVAACVLLASAWIAGWFVECGWVNRSSTYRVHVSRGAVNFTSRRASLARVPGGWYVRSRRYGRTHWLPGTYTYTFVSLPCGGASTSSSYSFFAIPIWIPLVSAAALTLWLFWRDRKRWSPRYCFCCNYDLTGNVSGR